MTAATVADPTAAESDHFARMMREDVPTGEHFRTRRPAKNPPLTAAQQLRNRQLLEEAITARPRKVSAA